MGHYMFNEKKFQNGQAFVWLLKFDLTNHQRCYMWEKK